MCKRFNLGDLIKMIGITHLTVL